ncbi:MAG: hypothetical protein U0361_21860 [Nitrospiraceae bacterium]
MLGMPYHVVAIDRKKIARYGINAEQILIPSQRWEDELSVKSQGNRRFFACKCDLVLKTARISSACWIFASPISEGRPHSLVRWRIFVSKPGWRNQLRENIQRRLAVEHVRGRDLGLVGSAQQKVASHAMPGGRIEWG